MAMTLTSIILPRWISWNSEVLNEKVMSPFPLRAPLSLSLSPPKQTRRRPTETSQKKKKDSYKLIPGSKPQQIHYTYGLHTRCSSLTHKCEKFPQSVDCHNDDRYFCSVWRSVGFLMSFAVVIEGMTFLSFVVMIAGGKQKRESGWKILAGLLFLIGGVQCAGMALIVKPYSLFSPPFPNHRFDITRG